VTGVSEAQGGSGDPSPVTAFGVLCAMRAVVAELDGEASVAGRHVVVQGAGHVGSHLARLLVAEGARVTASDLFPERADALASELGIATVAYGDALATPCDIFAPCALGGALDAESVAQVRCRAVVGAANNQLATPAVDPLLAERGVLYAPDFVVNAGGIINLAEEFVGYDRDRALARTAGIEATTTRVLAYAREHELTPSTAAERLARQRIAEEGRGRRWQPGDPAAWTNGEPLRFLRPPAGRL
jgi:glutamate dehydrogenase/leucine dehydrogenase